MIEKTSKKVRIQKIIVKNGMRFTGYHEKSYSHWYSKYPVLRRESSSTSTVPLCGTEYESAILFWTRLTDVTNSLILYNNMRVTIDADIRKMQRLMREYTAAGYVMGYIDEIEGMSEDEAWDYLNDELDELKKRYNKTDDPEERQRLQDEMLGIQMTKGN